MCSFCPTCITTKLFFKKAVRIPKQIQPPQMNQTFVLFVLYLFAHNKIAAVFIPQQMEAGLMFECLHHLWLWSDSGCLAPSAVVE
jgi:hypothetical protein